LAALLIASLYRGRPSGLLQRNGSKDFDDGNEQFRFKTLPAA
jgi:hypothetical protein